MIRRTTELKIGGEMVGFPVTGLCQKPKPSITLCHGRLYYSGELGFEPRQADPKSIIPRLQVPANQETYGNKPGAMDRALTKLFAKDQPEHMIADDDLATVIAAWPCLPAAIRRAILALVKG